MRYYIPCGKSEYLCIERGQPAFIVEGEPDEFSRVAVPPINWSRVKADLPFCEKEIRRAKRATVAYTRVWIK